jgi:hypothetical protein
MPWRLLTITAAGTLAVRVAGAPAPAQTDGEGSQVAAPTVEVLDPGDEPRAPLRYALVAGTSVSGTQSIDQYIRQVDQDGFGNSTRVPTIDLGLQLDVQEVQPDGTARVTFGFTSVEATGNGSAASSDQARAIEIALADVTDLTGDTTISNRGVPLDTSLDVPDDLPDTVRSILEQFESQASALTPPLPEEPLGLGARWRATTEAELNGIEFEQEFVYTLESMTGTQLELRITAKQRAAPQEIDVPNAPSGTEIRLLSYRAKGKGTTTFDLAAPLPVESEVKLHLVNRVRVKEREGDVETTKTTSDQEQRISSP